MTTKSGKTVQDGERPVSRGRHSAECKICSHAEREEIERAFVEWNSVNSIAARYSISRDSMYRHAHAFQLLDKRRRNVRAALEKIIEQADTVEVNAAAVVTAVAAYARINAAGQWIDRSERVDLNQLFEKMSAAELEAYASKGILPGWFEATVGATSGHGREDSCGR